jgi:hypothetical protein
VDNNFNISLFLPFVTRSYETGWRLFPWNVDSTPPPPRPQSHAIAHITFSSVNFYLLLSRCWLFSRFMKSEIPLIIQCILPFKRVFVFYQHYTLPFYVLFEVLSHYKCQFVKSSWNQSSNGFKFLINYSRWNGLQGRFYCVLLSCSLCFKFITYEVGSTELQGVWSMIRFPIVLVEFFIDIILLTALWPLGSTQSLTEMSIRNISWRGKGSRGIGLTTLPSSCADCLEIWEPQSSWNPQGQSRDCFTFT